MCRVTQSGRTASVAGVLIGEVEERGSHR
jgi:hypothetical protein